MTDTQALAHVPDDLIIVCPGYPSPYVAFLGTFAMLQYEGMLPEGMDTPHDFYPVTWEDTDYCYSLRRKRPEGAKGPRREFLKIDWFCLRRDQRNGLSCAGSAIVSKKKELEAAIYRDSPRGRAETNARIRKLCAASADNAFQAFKARVPGMIPPTRARKSKATPLPQVAVESTREGQDHA